jgi:PAS domain S-box-containing protein
MISFLTKVLQLGPRGLGEFSGFAVFGEADLTVGLNIVLAGAVAMCLLWVFHSKRQMKEQATLIRSSLEHETTLEQRYRDLVENASEIVYTHDLAGNCTSLNRAGQEILGFSAEEVSGLNISQILGAKQMELARRMIERKLAGESLTTYEIEVTSKDGRHSVMEVSSRPMFQNGKLVGVQGIGRDITERKRRENRSAAFSTLGIRLTMATEPGEAAWIVVDIAHKLLSWDACYMHLVASAGDGGVIPILNYDTIDGQRVAVPRARTATALAPMDQKVIEEGGQLILREGAYEPLEGLVTFGNTQRLSASLLFVPIRNGMRVIGVLSIQSYTPKAYDGESLNILQSLADLCAGAMERIQAEEELRKSEERFSKAFRATPISIAISTLDKGRIVDANDGYLRLFGFSRDEVIGRYAHELGIWINPEDRTELVRILREKRAIRNKEQRLRTKSGEFRDVLVSAEIIELGGEQCGLFIGYDLTERLHLETQLRHSQKMEAIGQLAAGIAHDFNNIMTIIQGHSSLALSAPHLDAEMLESWQEVSEASERAANLTRQLLTFSRRQIMQSSSLNLNALIRQVTKLLRRILGEDISLECNYAEALPSIRADSGMIDQLIMNLAVNARDAMPKGGRLALSTLVEDIDVSALQERAEARPGTFVCLSVIDTGCGMDIPTLGRIFEPFFTTKDVGKGTGLGLATAYGIVKQHQGWIEVKSEIGHGTAFKIYFPSESNTAESSSDKTQGAPRSVEIDNRRQPWPTVDII